MKGGEITMKYKMTKNIKTIVSLGIIFIIVISLKFNKERENNNNLIVVDKNINKDIENIDKVQSIQEIIANKDSIIKEELDKKIIEYVSNTKDIEQVFNVADKISTETIDNIAKEYIESTKDYGMYYSFRPFLSENMDKQLSNIVEENLGNIAMPKNDTIKNYSNEDNNKKTRQIQEIIRNKDSIEQEVLNEKMEQYVLETKDIGLVFNVADKLSTETIDNIAKEYIENTEDYGMYYSLKPFLSSEMNEELKQLVDKNLK